MRLTSKGAKRGEPTLLAIAETAAATVLAAYLCRSPETIGIVAQAFCLAPLLLLQTAASQRDSRRLFAQKVGRGFVGESVAGIILDAFTAKFMAVARGLFTNTKETLLSIPRNWVRVAFSLDSAHLPELVPGLNDIDAQAFVKQQRSQEPRAQGSAPGRKSRRHRKKNKSKQRAASDLTKAEKERVDWIESVQAPYVLRKARQDLWPILRETEWKKRLLLFAFLPFLCGGILLMFGVPLVYRFMVKSTTLLYSPLIWAMGPVYWKTEEAESHFVDTARWSLGRLTYYYSFFGLVYGAIVWLHKLGLLSFVSAARAALGAQLHEILVAPDQVPLWQVLAPVNAIVGLCRFWVADRALLQPGSSARTSALTRLRRLSVVSRVLSMYTVGCLIYLLAESAKLVEWAPIRLVIFPWSE